MCKNVYSLAIQNMPEGKRSAFRERWNAARIATRIKLWVAADGKCHYCHEHTTLPAPYGDRVGQVQGGKMASLDHIIPQGSGGTDSLNNLVLACNKCNSNRGAMSYIVFKTIMNKKNGWQEYITQARTKKGIERLIGDVELQLQIINQVDKKKHHFSKAQLEADRAMMRERLVNLKAQREEQIQVDAAATAARLEAEQSRKATAEEIRRESIRFVRMVDCLCNEARKRGIKVPKEKEARVEFALKYKEERDFLHSEIGIDGILLLRKFINSSRVCARSDGRGWVGIQGDASTDPYPWKDLTGDTEAYMLD